MKLRERLVKALRKFLHKKEVVRPEKVAILIDGENLYFTLQIELKGLEIRDWKEFQNRLAGGKELARPPIYYRSVDMEPEYPEKTLRTLGFLSHLEEKGYEIEKRPLLKGQKPQSEIDPVISDGIYRCAIDESISTIILVSGDHHFAPAVDFAKERGKKVKVVSTAASLSAELRNVSDEWIDLWKVIQGIVKKSEVEQKRKEALEKINEGKKINLSSFEEIP